MCNLLSPLSACSCFLLNIHAPPRSLVPKTHDIECCLTTISGERRTINGALFIGFTHGMSLTWPPLSFPRIKREQLSTLVVVLFLLNTVCPDAREQITERSSLLEHFRNLMHNVQQKRRLQIRPFAASRFFTLARKFI